MILGRVPEQERIASLLSGLHEGRGGALAMLGDPGIGKSSLLTHARDRAREIGVRTVTVTGAEAELHLPLAGLADVVTQLSDRLPGLPAAHADALRATVGLGPAAVDPLLLHVATFKLLQSAVPVLLVADDAHWIDPATSSCLGFVGRRVSDTGIGLIAAARTPVDPASWIATMPSLGIGSLDRATATALLARTSPLLAPSARTAVLDAAAGNPLALIELPTALDDDQRHGIRPPPEPLTPTQRLEHVYARRCAALTPAAHTIVVIVAAAGPIDPSRLRRAADALGVDPRSCDDALDAAVDAGVLAIVDDTVSFVHPLARSTAYHGAPRTAIRHAHRVLASLTKGDERVRHRAAATVPPDEEVADALQQSAAGAAARGAFAAASVGYEAASRYTGDPSGRAAHLVDAGLAALRGAQPRRASRLLSAVDRDAVDPALRPSLDRIAGLALRADGQAIRAVERWQAAMGQLDATSVAWAAMAADAAHTFLLCGLPLQASSLADDALAAARRHDDRGALVLSLAVRAACAAAQADTTASEAALADLASIEAGGPKREMVLAGPIAAQAEIWLGRHGDAERRATRQLGWLRDGSATAGTSMLLATLAEALEHLGRPSDAAAAAREASLVALDTGNASALDLARVAQTRLLARSATSVADVDDALSLLRIADGANPGLTSSADAWRGVLAGRVALSSGDAERALQHLEPVAEREVSTGFAEPAVYGWLPDLVEALAMARRVDDAARWCEALQSSPSANPVTRGAALRCRGILTPGPDGDAAFGASLALTDAAGLSFESARTELAFGRHLHRERRRVEARRRLRAAAERFAELDAGSWADRARAELAAAGGRSLGPAASTGAELTAREEEIVQLARAGLSNREIATRVFLSVKTVEFHLARAYSKLGIRRRMELVARD